MKQKFYAVVRMTLQREIEFEGELHGDVQELVEKAVAEKYGELLTDIDEPDEVEILEADYAENK